MFGYVRIYRPDLSEADYQRYRSVYCGLCKALGRELNQASRMALTYDVTFLCLLLFALVEEQAETRQEICIAHPLKKHWTDQDHVIYQEASLLTAALVYLKADDNVKDGDHLLLSKMVRKGMASSFARFCREQTSVRDEILRAQEALFSFEAGQVNENPAQNRDAPSFDHQVEPQSPFTWANCNGAFMLTLWHQFLQNLKSRDWHWAKRYAGFEVELESRLESLFSDLMQWIYFLDACDDWEEDQKQNQPNPFSFCSNKEELWQTALPVFYDLEYRLDLGASKLNFVRDAGIVANILRAGLPLKRQEIWRKSFPENGANTNKV